MEILSGLKVEIFVFDEGKFYATDSAEWVLKILRSFQKRRTDERSARAQSGARAALKKGKIIGRPKKVDASKIQKLRSKGLTIARIAKALSISVGAVHRSLNNRKLSHDEQSLI